MVLLRKLDSKGQTLFEIVAVVAVVSLVVIGLVRGLSLSLKNTRFVKERSLAENYLREASEWLIFQRDSDWDNLLTGSYCLNELNWETAGGPNPENCAGFISEPGGSDTVYKRNVTLTEVTADQEFEIVINVYWASSRNDGETLSLDFSLTKWK